MLDLDLVPVPAPSTTRVGERVLAAASDLFYNRGITAVGVDLLAEHAGTTKRTLYQRFGSKDGLIAAYLQLRAHTWQTALLAVLSAASLRTPRDRLTAVFRFAEEWAEANARGCAFVNAWAELNSTQSLGIEVIAEESAGCSASSSRFSATASSPRRCTSSTRAPTSRARPSEIAMPTSAPRRPADACWPDSREAPASSRVTTLTSLVPQPPLVSSS